MNVLSIQAFLPSDDSYFSLYQISVIAQLNIPVEARRGGA